MERRNFLKAMGIGCIVSCCMPVDALAAAGQRTYSKRKLLRDFDKKADARREMYSPLLEGGSLDAALDDMRDSYEALIPNIPFVGNHDFHLQWYIPNAEFLAEYLALKEYNLTALECAQRRLEKSEADLMAMPEDLRLRIGGMQFGPLAETQMRLRAWYSQLNIYRAAHIFTFVKGDGTDFDWGTDYTQCANCTLFKKYQAHDLLYLGVCMMDYVAGKAFRTGYHRTTQLATGGPKCDLRWKEGVESEIPDISLL